MAVPAFGDFGKKCKDLFKKQYDYSNSLKVHSKGKPVSVETTLESSTSAKSKISCSHCLGKAETNVSSKGTVSCELTMKDTLLKGHELKPKIAVCKKGTSFSLNEKYQQDGLTVTANLNKDLQIDAAAVANVSAGLDVGVSAKFDVAGSDVLADYNAGAQYSSGNVVIAWLTSKRATSHTVSWYQKLASGNLGVDVAIPASGDKTLRVGGETKVSDDLSVKGKLDNKGTFSSSVTHVLKKENIKLQLASEFDIFADDIAPSKIGATISLGDF